MTAFVIGFDLDKEGAKYSEKNKALSEAIAKVSGTHWHILDSTWIVVTTKSATAIRDELSPYIDSTSKLLVVQSAGVAAWKGFGTKGGEWLKEKI